VLQPEALVATRLSGVLADELVFSAEGVQVAQDASAVHDSKLFTSGCSASSAGPSLVSCVWRPR
jgi:hypothetical protein